MNAARVVVVSKELHEKSEFKGKTYGWQNAAIYNGGDFPVPFHVNVEAGHEYEPGEYMVAPASFIADEMKNLKLKRVKLLPMGGAVAQRPGK
jgi:hypothetical protein